MKRILFLAAAATAMLGACNKQPDIKMKNASVAEVAQKVSSVTNGGQFVRAGKWSSTVTMEEISAPGMPPQAQAAMKKYSMQAHSYESCLTPDEVKQPKADFFAGKDNSCRYDHFTMSGGKLDIAMRCSGEGRSAQIMRMNGTYSPDDYHMAMQSSAEGGDGSGGMSMKMHVDAHRIGECAGKES